MAIGDSPERLTFMFNFMLNFIWNISDPRCLISGSGGAFAVAAARALIDVEGMDAAAIAAKSMKIASDMWVQRDIMLDLMMFCLV